MKLASAFVVAMFGAVMAIPAQACLPVTIEITDYVWEPGGPVSFCLAPDREAWAFRPGGQFVAPELRCLIEIWTEPEPDLVQVGWWMTGAVVPCGSEYQMAPRDENGWITVLPGMRGSGHHGPDSGGTVGIHVIVCPDQILSLGTQVYFNSPDINSDLAVNLGDVTLFAHDFWGAYDYRSDFNWSGSVDLGDLTIMSQGNGATCQ